MPEGRKEPWLSTITGQIAALTAFILAIIALMTAAKSFWTEAIVPVIPSINAHTSEDKCPEGKSVEDFLKECKNGDAP